MSRWRRLLLVRRLRAVARRDRRRLRELARLHPGLDVHPDAAAAFAVATFDLEPGAKVRIGPGVVTERRPDGVRISVRSGGELDIGEGTWLRSDLGPVILSVFEGARIDIGRDSFLNGCHISAKAGVTIGREAWIGPGSRVWDADQHAIDFDTPERRQPVRIGHYVWIAADVTVLRGVEIGDGSVVGTRTLVTQSLPAGSLAYGVPAVVRGRVGDRRGIPI
ncbi:MAG: acyltransferase [Deltaproteobacteria bacterium]|nr:acyltransferase [Deltaproteobacteria bacterium]MBW2695485.1 acyltransferase [Deltaproteobacteria bacterium]